MFHLIHSTIIKKVKKSRKIAFSKKNLKENVWEFSDTSIATTTLSLSKFCLNHPYGVIIEAKKIDNFSEKISERGFFCG